MLLADHINYKPIEDYVRVISPCRYQLKNKPLAEAVKILSTAHGGSREYTGFMHTANLSPLQRQNSPPWRCTSCPWL